MNLNKEFSYKKTKLKYDIKVKPYIIQNWGQLLSNEIDYITITLQFSWLDNIMITSITS